VSPARRATVKLVDAATGAAVTHGEVVVLGMTRGENEGARLEEVAIRGESGTLEKLPPERVRVLAEARGWAPTAAILEPAEASVTVRLGRGASLVGTVADSAGQPVACLVVGVQAEGSRREIQVMTDAAGLFRVSGLSAGDAKLFLEPNGIQTGLEKPAGCGRGRPERAVVTPRAPVELRLGASGEVPVEIKLGLRERP
jgi:hypothetical protein